jgi:hypothetical protein
MNTKRVILLIALIGILVLAVVAWRQRPIPAAMQLNLTGTAGLKVAGTVVVDGVSREFSGVVPSTITANARQFAYTIFMQEPSGHLHGELRVANGVYGSSSAASDFSGVKGSYSHDWRGKGGMFTVVWKGE